MTDYDRLYQKLNYRTLKLYQKSQFHVNKKIKIIGNGKNIAESKHKKRYFMLCVVSLPHINLLCISDKNDYIYEHPHVKLVELGYELNKKSFMWKSNCNIELDKKVEEKVLLDHENQI